MLRFKEFLEAIEAQVGSRRTQLKSSKPRGGTVGTYVKSAEYLQDKLPNNSEVLDYGAGHGQGSAAMREILGHNHNVESYEPQPQGWEPHYTNSDDIKKQYDGVVSHNVLNVLQPKLRSQVTTHLLSLVKPSGHLVVNARKWKGDVSNAKNFTPSDEEEKALWVHGSRGEKTYHRGFDGDELLDHLKAHDPDGNFEFHRKGDKVYGRRK